eukprot:TRINITY_DN74457_c0_g1_i1.p1 TRINITY_DN74457_c0_g1~~TRINITY_DN74457_c0_g1_i1.p1  ORF type:complete len:219 (-),score=29.21 TRINITY_DN74457_c0_g1_i1:273-929(-)
MASAIRRGALAAGSAVMRRHAAVASPRVWAVAAAGRWAAASETVSAFSSSPANFSGDGVIRIKAKVHVDQNEEPLSDDGIAVARVRDADLRTSYNAIRSDFPEFAQPTDGSPAVDKLEAYRKRLIYRSKQRGWLEVDLLMGTFATKYVPGMNLEQMEAYERILSLETLDLYNVVTGKDPPPPDADPAMMKWLREYADSSPIGKASVEDYEAVKSMMSN